MREEKKENNAPLENAMLQKHQKYRTHKTSEPAKTAAGVAKKRKTKEMKFRY
jgi:hypothetical protein